VSNSVAIVSGGLDSTTLVYHMVDMGLNPHLLSFDYGQRHVKELEYARRTAEKLGLDHNAVDLSGINDLVTNSVLTDKAREVPDGHYAEENMKQTVVPNRNMIMLSVAIGKAVSESWRTVGFGVHSGDHFIYPDCRPEFIVVMQHAAQIGNNGFDPYVND
jgi:7-cyano-7-deazaguanine synthase